MRARTPVRRVRHRQRGLSLIELMIALVLGLIVVAAVFNVYAGTSKSQRFTAGLQSLQENGRFGLAALQRGLRLAGFSEGLEPVPFAPFDLDAGDDSTIVVRARRPLDCNGGDTSTAAEPGVAIDTYAFDGEAITCTGNVSGNASGGTVVLVENVDAFRVLYGLDNDADGVPNRFVPHDVAAGAGADAVVALRFALLVHSGPVDVRSRARTETFAVLDESVPKTDRRVREVFSTTVKLRN